MEELKREDVCDGALPGGYEDSLGKFDNKNIEQVGSELVDSRLHNNLCNLILRSNIKEETDYKSDTCSLFSVSEDINESMHIKEDIDKCKGRYCNVSDALDKENVHEVEVTQTVERRYEQCDICGTKLISKSRLKKHKLIHAVERPYECDVC